MTTKSDPPDYLDAIGNGGVVGGVAVALSYALLDYLKVSWSPWFVLPLLMGMILGGHWGHKRYLMERKAWEDKYLIVEKIKLTEEGSEIFLRSIENPPEPNENLKRLKEEMDEKDSRSADG